MNTEQKKARLRATLDKLDRLMDAPTQVTLKGLAKKGTNLYMYGDTTKTWMEDGQLVSETTTHEAGQAVKKLSVIEQIEEVETKEARLKIGPHRGANKTRSAWGQT
jgi:hypothetical protein